MKWIEVGSPLPLLVRELLEQAARRRTYVVRVTYAALLCLIFVIASYEGLSQSDAAVAQLGLGRGMFVTLVTLQFGGVFIFLPAFMSGVLTAEKERGALALLFLTSLRPWQILAEKYLGRLVPMFTLLLLSLPLLAVCYAFGGVTTDVLLAAVTCLVALCLQLGALSLLCSAYCATSLAALLSSYGLMLALYVGPLLLGGWWPARTMLDMFSPALIFADSWAWGAGEVFQRCLPSLASAVFFLLLARLFLVRRAFVRPRSLVLGFFEGLDDLFDQMNVALGDIRWRRKRRVLPHKEPVAWREQTKRSLGKLSHTVKLVLIVELAVLGACLYAVTRAVTGMGAAFSTLTTVSYLLWAVAALLVSVRSASAFGSERANQTLDVLLVSPVPTENLVRQKLRGVRRLIRVLCIPFVTVFLFRAGYSMLAGPAWYGGESMPVSLIVYLAVSIGSVFLFLSLVSWLSAWIGMKAKTQYRAVATTLAVLVLWNGGMMFVVRWVMMLIFSTLGGPSTVGTTIVISMNAVCPATVIGITDYVPYALSGPSEFVGPLLIALLLGYGGHYWLLWRIRRRCLTRADVYLGRARDRLRPARSEYNPYNWSTQWD